MVPSDPSVRPTTLSTWVVGRGHSRSAHTGYRRGGRLTRTTHSSTRRRPLGVSAKPDPALLNALRHLVSTDPGSLTNKKGKVPTLPVLIHDAGRLVIHPHFSVCLLDTEDHRCFHLFAEIPPDVA